MYSISKRILAEILGTFVLVLFGCGTAVVTGCSVDNPGAYLLTALAFGLSVVAMAYSVGRVSGGHFNPAVTIGVMVKGKIEVIEGLIYMISQCIGALLAGAALYWVFGSESGLGTNNLYNGSISLSIGIEIILTCVFVLVILSVTDGIANQQVAGLIIGLTLTFVHILGIGLTGTSVNPARSLGVALFTGGEPLNNLWVFIVAPLIGGVLAGLLYKCLIGIKEPVKSISDRLLDADDVEDAVKEPESENIEKLEEEVSAVEEGTEEAVEEVKEGMKEIEETVENKKEELDKKVAETAESVESEVEEVKEAAEEVKEVVEEKKEELSSKGEKEKEKE